MKVQRKINSNYLRRKSKRFKKGTRQLKIKTFRVQENTKKNQLNMLLEQDEKRCKKICKKMLNLLTRTNI